MDDNNSKQITNEQIEQYKPLINKIIQQLLAKKLPLMYDDMQGYAYEGLMYAYRTFREGTSQNFTQYAAWCIRNFILTGMNEEGHTIKFNNYHQKKAAEAGETLVVRSIDTFYGDDDGNNPEDKLGFLGVSDEVDNLEEFAGIIIAYVKSHFPPRDADIFITSMGFSGKVKGKDIAAKYGISSALVTITNKKIIRAIRENKTLMSTLECYLEC
jgi:RNA polymerase sigma factor (sigma-70 family)